MRAEHEPSEADRETAALRDLLARMQRLRKRIALPTLVATLLAVSIGTTAHALGYWPLLGALRDGSSYYVSTVTLLLAVLVCGAPVIAPGIAVYLLARARLRRAWQEDHRENGVRPEWLTENAPRFG